MVSPSPRQYNPFDVCQNLGNGAVSKIAAQVLPLRPLSGPSLRALQTIPAQTLLVATFDFRLAEALKSAPQIVPWTPVVHALPPEPNWLERAAKTYRGGVVWWAGPGPLAALPQGWKPLRQPWTRLARRLLDGQRLRHRHVGLVAPAWCDLEGLCGWLLREGASLAWCDDGNRHLLSHLRLCDIVMVFPGAELNLEARHLAAGATLIDLRPGSRIAGTALELTLGAYADAYTGALSPLLACLALGWPPVAQQETLIGLA